MSTLEYLTEHRMPVYAGITGILLASVLAYMLLHASKPEPVRPPPTITMVMIKPPPPPPPPKPLPQPKTITEPKMVTPVLKPVVPNQPPKAAPPKPASPAPALGTSLKSNGTPNAFDLSGSGSGDGIIGGSGSGGGGGGSYGAAVQYQIQQALQKNPITRDAAGGLVVRIWVDASGVITRVVLDNSSGDPKVDDAVVNQVLLNMKTYAPTPDIQMPIKMSLVGQAQ